MIVEDVCRIGHVGHLLRRAPALAGPLLEQADRIQVAVVQIRQPRLLHGRGDGHRRRVIRQSARDGDVRNQRRVLRLIRRQGAAGSVGRHRRAICFLGRARGLARRE